MDLRKIVSEVVDGIQVAQDMIQCWPSMNTVMNLEEFYNQLSYNTTNISRKILHDAISNIGISSNFCLPQSVFNAISI
jgi:hypothetical protein